MRMRFTFLQHCGRCSRRVVLDALHALHESASVIFSCCRLIFQAGNSYCKLLHPCCTVVLRIARRPLPSPAAWMAFIRRGCCQTSTCSAATEIQTRATLIQELHFLAGSALLANQIMSWRMLGDLPTCPCRSRPVSPAAQHLKILASAHEKRLASLPACAGGNKPLSPLAKIGHAVVKKAKCIQAAPVQQCSEKCRS